MRRGREGLAGRISELSSDKREILERLLKDEGADVDLAVIRPRRTSVRVPLSFGQQRLWFLSQVGQGLTVYNCFSSWWLEGALDVSLLERCLREIVRRHEVLRTTFPEVDGAVVQRIQEEPALLFSLIDLAGLPPEERLAVAHRQLAATTLRQPFDLAQGPLVRADLLALEPTRHLLFLEMHHIVFDGWSVGIFVRELRALYDAFSRGQPSPLPELPIQYGDFAVWQREWLQGEVLESQLGYWRKQLAGPLPALELPTDHPRPAVPDYAAGAHSAVLPRGLSDAVKELSRLEGATLFMTLLAAFQVLLGRCARQQDVLVGSPIAGRNRREVEGLIGFFVNSLVLRVDLGGDPTFRELLGRVREATLGAYAHQDLPFEKLVEELQPERDVTRNPIFQVMLALQSAQRETQEMPGLRMRLLEGSNETTRLDWELHVLDAEEGLVLASLFRKDLFETETIGRMVGRLRTLLSDIVAHPTRRISELTLMEDDERWRVVVDWNASGREGTPDEGVAEAVEGWARRTPEAVAVASGRERLSYSDLDRRANRLAQTLCALGVGPEVRVGVCAERSPEMVVGQLAILKAGGAYVPLDPGYPRERLAYMLRDSRVALLLTQERLLSALPPSQARVLCLDASEQTRAESEGTLPLPVDAANIAYVIYTSGSTGQPKGVEITHAGLRNLVGWHRRVHGVSPRDRATLLAAPGFDASVWELWPYLTAGASVHIPDEETRSAPSQLVSWLVRKEITLCFLPTPLAEAVLQEAWPMGKGPRALLTGGDKLHRQARGKTPFILFNHYGPTESTVVATWTAVEHLDTSDPPIGRPIDNTRVYVLDESLRPVPIGVAGELCIGGAGLARGYLGRADLTAERFVPDPLGLESGGRLYRTGDLVRHRMDGNLEFLGRIDDQVKIRGFRIELGEIETVLGAHPGVRECVVGLREDAPGDPRLCAYVVPSQDLVADDLRRYLQAELPAPMVPSAFVLLPTLPVGPHGKVERRALPRPTTREGAPHEAPRGEVEKTIAAIWKEVLGVERVGVRDNFFDLGGHSMLLIQVHRRLRAAFPERELPMVAFFAHPTVGSLAGLLRNDPGTEEGETAQKLQESADRLRDGRRRLGRRRQSRVGSGDAADA